MTTLTEADAVDGLRDALGLLKDREQVAERLLASSARHSFDPDKELDWDAPFEDGKWFWPPELVSLYDTPLWKRMGEEQRILLSQHEAAALASLGIWFELILMSSSCSSGTSTTRRRPVRMCATRSPRSRTSAGTRRCSRG